MNNKLGLDQQPAVNRDVEKTNSYLDRDAQRPQDVGQPSIRPLPFEANNEVLGGYVQGGTVLSSSTYEISDSGIVSSDNYSYNDYEQRELKARQEYQRQLYGKGIHQQPPRNSGFVPYESVDYGVKPSSSEIEELRKQEQYRSITNRLRSLKQDENVQTSRLTRTRSLISELQRQLEALTTSKTEN